MQAGRVCAIAALVLLCIPAALELSSNDCYGAKRKESVVKMAFERSGGFAGAAVAVKGEVVFDQNAAKVTAAPNYEHALSDMEVRNLKNLLVKLPEKIADTNTQQRDQFQYDVVITASSGQSRHLTIHPDGSPEVNQVLEWIAQECDRIWSHRASE